jgi:DNA repair exonuclease SbcCD ATPase subunit
MKIYPYQDGDQLIELVEKCEYDDLFDRLESEKLTRNHIIKRGVELERELDEANKELHQKYIEFDALFDEAEQIRIERDEARAEAAKWKANHNNQVALKSAIIQRPDLGDRAERVQSLIQERNEARQKLAILQDLLNDLEDPLQLIAEYWDKDETLESMTGACWHAVGTAEKALEKIRPHLTYYGS